MTRFQCISADSHVVEPPNTFVDYIDPKYRDRAPHVEKEDGNDVYKCEGVLMIGVAAHSPAGRSRPNMHGTYEKDVWRGAYDPHARLGDMAKDGVEAEVIYPTIALRMFAIPDSGLRTATFNAYNSWLGWYCGAHPNVLKGIGMLNLDDLPTAIAELKRIKKLGLSGGMIPLYAEEEDLQYDEPGMDPFWAVAQDLDLTISLHTVTDKGGRVFTPLLKPGRANVLEAVARRATHESWVEKTLARMIFGGVFNRFPKLKIISAENDAGWAAYFVERIDYLFDRRRGDDQFDLRPGSMRPSDFFRRNVWCTFMRDHAAVAGRDIIGVDRIMWSNDFPHSDSTWPNSQKVIASILQGVPEKDKKRIIADNAAALYQFS